MVMLGFLEQDFIQEIKFQVEDPLHEETRTDRRVINLAAWSLC